MNTINICRLCGKLRSEHDGILEKCLGQKYQYFKPTYTPRNSEGFHFTDIPVCPHCGHCIEEYNEYMHRGFDNDGDKQRIDCLRCEEIFDVELNVEYSFNTTIPDLEAEKKKEELEQARRKEENRKVREFTPGTKVRIIENTLSSFAKKEGVVNDQEVQDWKQCVSVKFPNGQTWFFIPDDLERI